MDEDRLTPQMGRLIDAAKGAAGKAEGFSRVEGVAVLTEDGSVYVGWAGVVADQGQTLTQVSVETSAGGLAVAAARKASPGRILAAAVAGAGDCGETVLPSSLTVRALAEVAPELPLVLKRHGRWVLSALSEFVTQ